MATLDKLRKFNCPKNQLAYKGNVTAALTLKTSKKDFYNNLNVKNLQITSISGKLLHVTLLTLKDENIILVGDDKVVTAETD